MKHSKDINQANPYSSNQAPREAEFSAEDLERAMGRRVTVPPHRMVKR